MPPAGMPRPPQAALDALVAHLETSIDKAALAAPTLRQPAIHRLNRSEYGNAIRDLFALDVDVAALLPPDEEAYGFDNNATVLNISTSLMERYLSAAWKISSLAVASPKITPSPRNVPRARRPLAARPRRLACRSARAAASPSATTSPSTAST